MTSARRVLLPILAVALLLRVGLVIATPDYTPTGDPAEYELIAGSVARGNGYPPLSYATPGGPSALRPPGYPYFVGGVYAVSGDSRTAARLAGALLGTGAVVLIFLIALELWPDRRRAATVAGWLAAAFPPLILLGASLLSEALFVPLVLAATYATLRLRRDPRLGWAAAVGALTGACALTRSAGLLLAVPLGIGIAGAIRPPRRAMAALGAAAVCGALVIAPWTIRNAAELHAFVPIATQDGYTFAGEYNELADRPDDRLLDTVWQSPPQVGSLRPLFERGLTEPELNSQLRDRATSYMADHPGYVARAVIFNSLRMVQLNGAFTNDVYHREAGVPSWARRISQLSVYLVVLLALGGAVVLVRRREGPLWLWLVPVAMWLAVAPVLGTPRYRAPIDPFLVLLAAAALDGLIRSRRRA